LWTSKTRQGKQEYILEVEIISDFPDRHKLFS
jgi:hypothetical protein